MRGREKGRMDAVHGLPAWWAVLKAAQKDDMAYLGGYMLTVLSTDGTTRRAKETMGELVTVYRYAACRVLLGRLLGA